MSSWKPIKDIPDNIRQGDEFIARWIGFLDTYEYGLAYYGQFGHCFLRAPIGYCVFSETELDPNKPFGQPEIFPEEFCEIPEYKHYVNGLI